MIEMISDKNSTTRIEEYIESPDYDPSFPELSLPEPSPARSTFVFLLFATLGIVGWGASIIVLGFDSVQSVEALLLLVVSFSLAVIIISTLSFFLFRPPIGPTTEEFAVSIVMTPFSFTIIAIFGYLFGELVVGGVSTAYILTTIYALFIGYNIAFNTDYDYEKKKSLERRHNALETFHARSRAASPESLAFELDYDPSSKSVDELEEELTRAEEQLKDRRRKLVKWITTEGEIESVQAIIDDIESKVEASTGLVDEKPEKMADVSDQLASLKTTTNDEGFEELSAEVAKTAHHFDQVQERFHEHQRTIISKNVEDAREKILEVETAASEGRVSNSEIAEAANRIAKVDELLSDSATGEFEEKQDELNDCLDQWRSRLEAVEQAQVIEEKLDEAMSAINEKGLSEASHCLETAAEELDSLRNRSSPDTIGKKLESQLVNFDNRLKRLRSQLEASQISDQLAYAEQRYRLACNHLDRRYFSDTEDELTKVEDTLESISASKLQPEERAQFEELETNLKETRAKIQDEKHRKEFEDALDEIDTYIAEGQDALENESFDAATGKFGYATQCCNKAERMASRVDGGESTVDSRREKIDHLLEETRNRRQKHRVLDSMETAETRIKDGNDCVTDGSFTEAIENYGKAIDLLKLARQTAEANELSCTWELSERLEQVEQYRHHAAREREQQREERREEAVYKLDRAEQLVEKGHQHLEIDDVNAAIESQRTANSLVTEAATLLEGADVPDSAELHDRIDTLDRSVAQLDSSIDQATEETSGGPSRQQLIQYLQDLAVMFDESPSEDFVREYGKYPVDEYHAAFGSWTDALKEANLSPVDQAARDRRKYSRADILDAVVELAEQLGHNPSLVEMNQKGSISGTTVVTRFGDMDTAIELASLKDVTLEYSETDIEDGTNEEEMTATVGTEPTTTTAEPSEPDLEELTEVSGVLESDAAALAKAGYTSKEKLKEASAEDLQAIDGIDMQLALRIKADIEG